jgi:hypothetical protein
MTDPFSVIPRDENGYLSPLAWIKHHAKPEAFRLGWRQVATNDGLRDHHNEYSVLCWWPGKLEDMRVPG